MEENTQNNENIIKVKEESLRIQERDIYDQVKNIDNENTKSWIIIWFVWTIIAFWFSNLWEIDICLKIWLFISWILPITIALLNIWSKTVWYHISVNDFFVKKEEYSNYEKYLNDLHLTYLKTYKNVSNLLNKKANLTKISYVFTTILFIFILLIKLF